jgi:hypothetical protein
MLHLDFQQQCRPNIISRESIGKENGVQIPALPLLASEAIFAFVAYHDQESWINVEPANLQCIWKELSSIGLEDST